jgi:hypothetical protein
VTNIDPLLQWWYTAAHQQVGIILVCSDARRVMNKLYAARRANPDPAIENLAICLSPTAADELWIVHKTVHLKEEPDASEER